MLMRRPLVLSFVLALVACANSPTAPEQAVLAAGQPASAAGEAALTSGLMLQNFDRTVRPQDDLYRFVNGTWLAKTEIPSYRSTYGAFEILHEQAEADLRAIVEDAAAAKAPVGSDQQLVGDFYASFMDEAAAERLGLAPLQPQLDRIAAIGDRRELLDYLARSQRVVIDNPIGAAVIPDAKNPDVNALWLYQSGFGLPERDYYFSDEKRLTEIRAAYEQHIAKVFTLAGREDADAIARRLMAFETQLAQASWPAVRLRELSKLYNPVTLEAAEQATPGLDWSHWLAVLGRPDVQQVVLAQPDYFLAVGKALQEVPLETWRDYLTLRAIDDFSPYLNRAFVDEHFDFYRRTLSGVPEQRPRWKRALAELESSVGDLMGKEYVARHFPPEARQRMEALVQNLLKAFAVKIDELDWMGPDTKREAHAKVASFTAKIGYPDKWRDYPGLVTRKDDLAGNVLRARQVNSARELAKIGKPVDEQEWGLTPQTVNAYYDPLANEILFPAAILQRPFFDMTADDAVNYGAIGSFIGHEISHGFDDQGRQFDGTGALRDWWTAEDNLRFMERANILVRQYGEFSPLPGLHVNGELTLGENIGDLSGVAVAHRAYLMSLGEEPAPEIDGFSGEQRFFIGWAQAWANKMRDDELRQLVVSDPHPPAEYRVNGVVRNLPEFGKAFALKEGDTLYLPTDQQVRIW